jgi:divalent metal cation (Fe/Co/Zn/Cd) transporter
VLARLMDAVDPALVERATAALQDVAGVVGVDRVRLRWIGHTLRAEVDLSVPPGLSIERAHTIAHAAEHELTHAVPRLTAATVHAHPAGNLVAR